MAYEPYIRIGAFCAVFAAMVLWELALPRRSTHFGRRPRWPSNLGIVLVNTLALRVVFPGAAVGMAVVAESYAWGGLNIVDWPVWLEIAVAFVLLDFTIYLQHVLFHAVPGLWRFHRMHHADLDFDVTTGLRFHPVEILASMALKWAAIAALGAPAVAVLLFEVVLNATSMFNHGNVRIPRQLDRWLRWWVVTPEMHRVHHSIARRETNSNFGFNLPWWDRLLGTYRDQPEGGHEGMTIGIEQFREPRELGLRQLLTQPFRDDPRGYPINR